MSCSVPKTIVAVHVCTSDIILSSYTLPSSLGWDMDDASSINSVAIKIRSLVCFRRGEWGVYLQIVRSVANVCSV